MEPPVPNGLVLKGPLVARWRSWSLDGRKAGSLARARAAVENAGTATWHTRGETAGIHAAYHWLDDRGNAIVWDGLRTALPHPVAPGETVELEMAVRLPLPPGRYRFALDLVDEGRFWLAELGNHRPEEDVDIVPRIERRLAVVGAEVAGQEERLVARDEAEAVAYLAPGIELAPDWSRRVLDAHQEGYGIVGGSVEAESRRARKALELWAPGGGRVPSFPGPLLCPSVVQGVDADPVPAVEGLPGIEPPRGEGREPWLYDARIGARLVRAPRESGRPLGRRRTSRARAPRPPRRRGRRRHPAGAAGLRRGAPGAPRWAA
jgi:hypothetical protein